MADLTRIKKIKCTENHEHEIDAIAWDGYETSDLATIDGRDLLAGGDITTMEEVTYDDLVSLRNGGYLIPGKQYRITDYNCVDDTDVNQLMLHPFDIIVTADTTDSLNEKARACLSKWDTYFSENGANLDAWQIWYCLDGDRNRFDWADPNIHGRGVIYRMIDEWGNDCPYDFKNIQFERWCYESGDALPTIDCVDSDTQTRKKFYTFSYIDENGEIHDYSVKGNNGSIAPFQTDLGVGVYKNIIAPRYIYTGLGGNPINHPRQSLNNIVFVNTTGGVVCENTFGVDCYNNTLGSIANKNIFGEGCYNNTLGHLCEGNTFGNGCVSNTFANECSYNTFETDCGSNAFDIKCTYNTFGSESSNNTFGEECSKNTLGIKCTQNTFHSSCGGNTFGTNCDANILYGNNAVNTFGNTCYSNTLGEGSCYNIFGNVCSRNTFDSNCSRNILSNSCMENEFSAECTGNSLGSECAQITLSSDCKDNSFGNGCSNINLGEDCIGNSFGNFCQYNNFQISKDYEWPLEHCCYNHFDDGCSNIRIICNKRNTSDCLKNININRGVCGSRGAEKVILIHNINSQNEINVYNDKGHIYVDYGDINVTYEQLKTLVANGQLTPGRDYRIIDYVTTTSQEGTKSAGHQFDIIVTALDENTLSEEAKAIQHDGDSYFTTSNLSAWKIWYSLDNDTYKFAWAGNSRVDKTYTKLEYANECEYAFTIPYQMDDEVGKNQFDEWVVVKGKMINDTEDLGTYDQAKLNEVFSHWDYMKNADGDFILTMYPRLIDGVYQSGNYQDNGLSVSEYYQYDGVTTIDGIDYDLWKKSDVINGHYSHVYLITDRIVTTKAENPTYYTRREIVEIEPKGVIYRMIDEFNNDCPYDFKNILFTRYGLVENNLFDSVLATGADMYLESLSNNVKLLFDEGNYINMFCGFSPDGRNWNGDGRIKSNWDGNTFDLYTFTSNISLNSFHDATIPSANNSAPPRDNKIEKFYKKVINTSLKEHVVLSNNVFICTGNGDTFGNILSFHCEKNTIIGGSLNIFEQYCTNNILTYGSYNIFGHHSHANILGFSCDHITLGYACEYNSFFDSVEYISLGNTSTYNAFAYAISHFTFGDNCGFNCISDNSTDCNFNSGCNYNILYYGGNSKIDFGNNCEYNKIEEGSYEIVFGNNCRSNIIGYSCFNIYFGNDCMSNEILQGSVHNIFGNSCNENMLDYESCNNTFGDDCVANIIKNGFGNTFGSNCKNNVLEMGKSSMDTGCNFNRFELGCNNNTIGYKSFRNSFGAGCYSNELGYSSLNNSFGAGCNNNTLGSAVKSNTFGSDCAYNTFSGTCINNSMGNDCTNNTLGIYCRANSFGNMCKGNMLGNYNSYNSFGNACLYNGFKRTNSTIITQAYNNAGGSATRMVANGTALNYTTNIHFGDGCEHIILLVPTTDPITNTTIPVNTVKYLTNCYIPQGIKSKLATISGGVSYNTSMFVTLTASDLNSDGLLFVKVGTSINKCKLSDLLPA